MDRIMATANDMDFTQNGIINNVYIPSSPSRFVITDEFINDNEQSRRVSSAESSAPRKGSTYRCSTEALNPLIKKVDALI
ncbi:hypothetical protein TNCV_3984271 [Trichonephila clavipes]|nr:hypothetical protein TNCV_3984271 [Trichonephila clavipes]